MVLVEMHPQSLRPLTFATLVVVSACSGMRVAPTVDVPSDIQAVATDVATPVMDDSNIISDAGVVQPQDVPTTMGEDVASDAPSTRCVNPESLRGMSTISIMSGGRMRTAQVYLPAAYDPTRKFPVILGFHGFLEDPAALARESALDRRGPERGYITILPAGLNNSWNAGPCCGLSASGNVNDVQFVHELLQWLDVHACIDRKRVFATGFSNGGMLAHRLACEMADEIAAVAPTSGVLATANCAPSRPISVLHSHGTGDLVVPYAGSPALQFPPVIEVMRGWATRNLCEMVLQETFNRGDARCVRYPNCRDGVETIRCDVTNGGHTWPGGVNLPVGGLTSRDLDTTAMLLDFFDRHPLP